MTRLAARLRQLRSGEDGNPTVEFALLFPGIIALFIMGFEIGLMTVRETMLNRATDLVVRDLRLSTGQAPDYAEIRRRICARSSIIPDCESRLRLELEARPLEQWTAGTTGVRCIDQDEPVDPATEYLPGQQNELMMIRVCSLFDPVMPTTGLGFRIKDDRGLYAITAVAAFVNEPED